MGRRLTKQVERSQYSNRRKRKKIIVLGCEGNNKTEREYFIGVERKINRYHFVFVDGSTNPYSIVTNMIKKIKDIEFSEKGGDLAYAVFDVDNDQSKKKQIQNARMLAKKNKIKVITSNPCFEIWYLEHFNYTTKQFIDSNAVIYQLKKDINKYKKTTSYIDVLWPKTNIALNNTNRLHKHHDENNIKNTLDYSNPNTYVNEILLKIMNTEKKV